MFLIRATSLSHCFSLKALTLQETEQYVERMFFASYVFLQFGQIKSYLLGLYTLIILSKGLERHLNQFYVAIQRQFPLSPGLVSKT